MPPSILVVDNNPVLQKAISALLEKEGCEVVTADNGLQALDCMKTYVPDMIFTDLVMPLVDGAQLCKVVKNTKRLESVYIVVVSAIIFEEEKNIMEDVEYDLYIEKGNLKELKAHLQHALQLYHKNQRITEKVIGSTLDSVDQYNITSEIFLEKKHREEIVACLLEGVVELDGQGKIVEINRAALNILDYREEELIGLELREIGWGEHCAAIEFWVETELYGKGMKSLEIDDENPVFRNEKVLTVTLIAVSKTNHFGICIINDITRQYNAELHSKKLESSLRQLKKMEAMSGMAGGMAHDFNNLLTVICGNLDMLKLSLKQKDNTLLEQARQSATKAVELVQKISNFSPFGVIERKKLNIEDVVREAVSTFSCDRPLHITLTAGKKTFIVEIDKKQILTALQNIFQNSVDANGGDKIEIIVSRNRIVEPIVDSGQYVPAGDYVEIGISDSGKGIEKDNLTLIFDPYYTSKPRGSLKGMGLGLAVVYATVRNHDGYIVVNSTVGSGTTVTIYLPINKKSYVKNAADWVTGSFSERNILVIDNDENNRHMSVVIMEYLGFKVLSANSEAEIFEECENFLLAGKTFAAAFVNLSEGDSLYGVRVCRKLHQLIPDLKVIAMSSSLSDPVIEDYKSYGFSNVLPKPYTVDDIIGLLSKMTDRK